MNTLFSLRTLKKRLTCNPYWLITASMGLSACGGSNPATPPSAVTSTPNVSSSSSSATTISSSSPGSVQASSSRPAFDGSLADTPITAPTTPLKVAPVTLTRLNRTQYNNTVRDLLGTHLTPADDFPEDDFGSGFNSIGESLSVSGLHLEQYHQAAEALSNELINTPNYLETELLTAPNYGGDIYINNGFVSFWNTQNIAVTFNAPAPGRYKITAQAIEYPAGVDTLNASLTLNGQTLIDTDINGTIAAPQSVEFTTTLSAGLHRIALNANNPQDRVSPDVYRGLGVRGFTLEGPISNPAAAQFECQSAESEANCASRVLAAFTPKAWRRPLNEGELDTLLALYDQTLSAGGNHDEALANSVIAILLSPHFIYRPELTPSQEATPLDAYALASRLSYFLWSSMPDAELFTVAGDGSLLQDDVLAAQTERLLASPNANSLIENFAVQWLKFDKITQASPNPELFPSFDNTLIEAMRNETRLFISELIETNAPVNQLFSANFSYLNNTLATHYGITGNFSDDFERYEWAGGDRQGILGQASVLTATAHPSTTSPVKRGVWVLENLLCQEPPPPPPGVENISDSENAEGLTTRERFAKHSDTNSSCRACHTLMDPIGFGLENYNPIGQWRDFEGTNPIDATGTLPGNTQFDGAWELNQLLATSPRLPLCAAEHLLTYALSRGVEGFQYGAPSTDYTLVHSIYSQTKDNGNRFGDMIKAITLSPAFRQSLTQTEPLAAASSEE